MKRLISTLTVFTALVVAGLVQSPAAHAMVPPEPASSTTPSASTTAVWGLSWTSLIALIVAVAVVAIAAVVIARLARRTHAPHASAA